jgi:hypothetical protein
VVLSSPGHVVYSAHDYGPSLFQQAWFNSATTPASLDAVWNKYWGYIYTQGTAPVWVGEFGTDNTASNIESSAAGSQGQWFESLVCYLSWTATWTFPSGQQIASGWSGVFTESGANVTVTNEPYNGSIAPGSSVTIGFTATGTAPSSLTVTC